MTVHAYNSSPVEVETGRSQVQGHLPSLLSKFEVSLGYMRSCLTKKLKPKNMTSAMKHGQPRLVFLERDLRCTDNSSLQQGSPLKLVAGAHTEPWRASVSQRPWRRGTEFLSGTLLASVCFLGMKPPFSVHRFLHEPPNSASPEGHRCLLLLGYPV